MKFIEKLFALVLLLFLAPLLILTSIIIKISSPGPVLYKPVRIGFKGKEFVLYKFRSMHQNSGAIRVVTLENDDRVFRFGKFIRIAKIDELPQLLNIIKGDMSFIGPRPEDKVVYDEYFNNKYNDIYNVRPGLSSPASLYDFTHGETYDSKDEYIEKFLYQKLDLELYYAQNKNFFYDIKIFLKTVKTIFLKILGFKNFSKPEEFEKMKGNYNE